MGRFTARLEACDPARDLRRAYTLEAGVDLFGAWLVVVAYGRIGWPGRRLVYVLATEAEACRVVRARLRRRAGAVRRIGVAYELRRLTDPDGWSAGLLTASGCTDCSTGRREDARRPRGSRGNTGTRRSLTSARRLGGGGAMQLKDIMTRDPVVLSPETPLKEAARQMRELDSGVMPVGEADRLLGMLTDRDLTIRATAEGRDPNTTPVRDVMTPEVVYCFEDDDVRDAAMTMEQHQIRRLIVLSRDERLVGIVALGDIAVHAPSDRLAGEVTEAVSEPGDVER